MSFEYIKFRRGSEAVADLPRQKGSEFENTETALLLSQVFTRIIELGNRASAGEKAAAEYLYGAARLAITELRAVVDEKPKLIGKLIEEAPQWPLLVSLHRESERANRRFLKKINLGARATINAHAGARWDSANVATVWANDAIETIRANQQWYKTLKAIKKPFPKWVAQAAKLPPLSKETASDWWKVGRAALLERFPDPHKIPELQTLAFSEKGDGRKRGKVLHKIGSALRSMAAQQST